MAIIKGPFKIKGSIQGVSFYTMRGSDKVIMRTKGGASKEKIRTSPKFAKLRMHQKEWDGCTKFGSYSRYAFGGLHRVSDYNMTPKLNSMGKNLIKLDTVSEVGKRSLKLSIFKHALEEFNFNIEFPISTVLRVTPRWELDREKLKGSVTFPRINTDINLLNIQKLPFFRLIIAIGTISDLKYNPDTNEYEPVVVDLHGHSDTVTGEWYSTQTIVPEQTMSIQMSEDEAILLTEDVSVLLSMAVEFGNVGFTGKPVEVKYAGCGKVIAVR
jgi:hypothetical protein